MKLQNLTVIFIVIILPIILIVSLYINTGIKTIKYQALYDTALLNATHDAIYAFEQNTANNKYSDNAETKRSIIKSSIKMFETSLANAAGISAYSSDEIEEYIPAIVFGLYDGFYMYAPSYNTQTGKYEHGLKNYVYYSETLDDGTVIRYSLDNYISVTVEKDGQYYIKEGYLINLEDLKNIDSDNNGKADEVTTLKYKAEELVINKETINGEDNYDAIEYFKDAYDFSYWFLKEAKIQEKEKDGTTVTYLNIGNSNDPENESSAFVQHKRKIIKEKMEGVLNSTITAYSNRTWGQNYKMPKLSIADWNKIYNNISVTTFFQGKIIGLTKYNGYCVLNSTNSREYVNPNLMYFIDNTGYYHDIRCEECKNATTLTGYRIGNFGNKKVTDSNGEVSYKYDHNELACYECINGTENSSGLVYDYITGAKPNDQYPTLKWKNTKESYWTSLARERYNASKLISDIPNQNEPEVEQEYISITVKKVWEDNNNLNGKRPTSITVKLYVNTIEKETINLSSANNWEKIWENLPKYNEDGSEITYGVEETNIPTGYTSRIVKNRNTFIITNTYTQIPETTSRIVQKVWDDNNNEKGKRPRSIIVKLYADNVYYREVELSEDNAWIHTWDDLPKYNGNQEINYTIKESSTVNGYEEPSYKTEGNKFIITNKYKPITIEDCEITLTVYDKLGKLWYKLDTDWTDRKQIKIEASVNKNIPIKLTVNGNEYTENDSSITREFSEGNKFTIVASVEIDGQVKTKTRVIYKGEKNTNSLDNVKRGNIYNGDNPFNKKGPECMYVENNIKRPLKYIIISSGDNQIKGDVSYTRTGLYSVLIWESGKTSDSVFILPEGWALEKIIIIDEDINGNVIAMKKY